MKNLILTGAAGAAALLVTACGSSTDANQPAGEDTAAVAASTADVPAAATVAATDWPTGTRIVQEGDTIYRIDPNGTRVAIDDGSWRIVTEDGVRYRVDPAGTRVRIDDRGLDLEGAASGPDIPGVDVDIGKNTKGHLDVDVSTNGKDASNDQVRETR